MIAFHNTDFLHRIKKEVTNLLTPKGGIIKQ